MPGEQVRACILLISCSIVRKKINHTAVFEPNKMHVSILELPPATADIWSYLQPQMAPVRARIAADLFAESNPSLTETQQQCPRFNT